MYERDGSRVILKTEDYSIVIAMASDPGWARIIVRDLNRIKDQQKKAS